MRIYGNHFEYNGQSSRKYGLIFAVVESNHNYAMAGETKSVVVYNDTDKRSRFVYDSFENSALKFEAEVVCDRALAVSTQREIQKWLFNQNGYRKLYFDIADDCLAEYSELVDGELKRTYLNCRFVNPSRLEYFDGVVGYRFTVECDSIMGWQDPITKTYQLPNTTESSKSSFKINLNTDINDYVYPNVVITVGNAGGQIGIVNKTDDALRSTTFIDTTSGCVIAMRPDTGYITDGYYNRFVDKNFMRLLDGENEIEVFGNIAKIEITWQNARYV